MAHILMQHDIMYTDMCQCIKHALVADHLDNR